MDDNNAQVTVYSGRGILSQSAGPVWMVGTGVFIFILFVYILIILCLKYNLKHVCTQLFPVHFHNNINAAEHHTLYQYSLAGAQNHYMGLIQTETVSTDDYPFTITH